MAENKNRKTLRPAGQRTAQKARTERNFITAARRRARKIGQTAVQAEFQRTYKGPPFKLPTTEGRIAEKPKRKKAEHCRLVRVHRRDQERKTLKLNKLRAQATNAARVRKHTLEWSAPTNYRQTCTCMFCGKTGMITINPQFNETEVGGDVMNAICPIGPQTK